MLSLFLLSLGQVEPMADQKQVVASDVRVADSIWKTTAPAPDARARVAYALSLALESDAAANLEDTERLRVLRSSASAAAEGLGDISLNGARLKRALDAASKTAQKDGEKPACLALRKDLELAARDLAFEPLVESPRPVGFPAATVVGEIELLTYPAYRMARTRMPRSEGLGQNSAFWKLFQHIQSHEIPMTAPVEMTWQSADSKTSSAALGFDSMAFLYVSTDVGRLGTDGEVEVVDVPAATVVSLGVRGASGAQRVQAERERLADWILSRPERYEIAGPPRMMGWNSPMVRDAKRYFEIQYPVRLVEPAK